MKKLLVIAMVAILCSINATAQSHIEKIMDELENNGVDVSKVVKRDPKTKKVYSITKSLSFYSKEGKYAKRLKEAFKKDAENAVEEVIGNHGNNFVLKFIEGNKHSTYTLSISEGKDGNPLVRISMVMSDGDHPKWGALNLNGLESLKDLGNLDWERYGNDMERWDEEFSKKMEKIGEELEKRKQTSKKVKERIDSIIHLKKAEAAEKARSKKV